MLSLRPSPATSGCIAPYIGGVERRTRLLRNRDRHVSPARLSEALNQTRQATEELAAQAFRRQGEV